MLRAPRNEGSPVDEAVVERLKQFVEDLDISFHEIASRTGTSAGMLSIWLVGRAKLHAEELAAIENVLRAEEYVAHL